MTIIVLEHPRIRSEKHFNDIANTPLWSCLMGGYAAAALQKAGHEVLFRDATKGLWDFSRTEKEILNLSPDMLAVNAVYFWEHTPRFFDFLTGLRLAGFEGHICLFGFFPTLAFQAILKEVPAVDSVVVGECETTLVELAERLSKGQDWDRVPGVAYRTDGIGCLPDLRRPGPDPDKFPFPVRDPGPADTVSILASRGCYNHCSFCPVPVFYSKGPLWRGRSTRNVVEEMAWLVNQGAKDFYFVDPNFIGPGRNGKARILELAGLIRPMGVTFGMETRPADLEIETLECLVSAGLRGLLLGIESGSASVLGRLSKGEGLRTGEQAIRLCRSVGIEPEIGFLMFVPDSTLEDLEYNLEFLQANNLLDRLDRTANLLCHCQIVLKGTSDYGRFKEQGRLTETGPLGFEGEISFLDDRVKWMSELVVNACLSVLRHMSRPESPVFWRQSGNNPACARVNRHLVDLFQRLLHEARKTTVLPPVNMLMQDIASELRDSIGG